MISVLKFIQGYVYVSLQGARVERFLNMCVQKKLLLWNLQEKNGVCYCNISRRSLLVAKELLAKTGTRMEIVRKCGLPFLLYRHRKRRLFFLGCALAFVMLYVMSLFLWDIEIEGNESYQKKEIMKFVTDSYAHGGQLISTINCIELEEELRTHFEKFAWVSCEIAGTKMTIHIKETINLKLPNKAKKASDLIANKTGKIASIVTRTGTPKVKAGDIVKTGEVLISGTISYQNDEKESYANDYVAADGDIIAQTISPYKDRIALQYYKKQYTGEKKNGYVLHFFGKKVTLYQPKKPKTKYDVIKKKRKFKLGKTFYFPVFLTQYEYREYTLKRVVLTTSQAKQQAKRNFKQYCDNLCKKGVEIVENSVKIRVSGENLLVQGDVTLLEPIGKISLLDSSKKENVDEHSGKTD